VGAIRLDDAVLTFGLGVTTLVGLVVGLVPALRASRSDLRSALQRSAGGATGGRQLMRRALVVAEVALAFVLLAEAGLLMRSLQRLFAISPGFDTERLLTMQVSVSGRRFGDDATRRFFAEALQAARSTPGVTAAAFTSQLPLSGELDEYGASFEDDDPTVGYSSFRYTVSPGYFEIMGIPLRRGRLLDSRDVAGAPLVALISESLAQRKFHGQDPIDRRVRLGPPGGPLHTIVGVVGDVKQASLAASHADAFYTTPEQWRFADNAMSLVVRARGDAAALAPDIRKAIWSVDKNQAISRIATMDDLLARSAAERRFALTLLETFGLVALALAATGIYGVLSGGVAERAKEIGLRLALGASRNQILALVFRQGMAGAGLGAVIGLSGALVATRAIVTLLFGVSRLDPMTYLGVSALLLGVSAIACWVPAWRAARVDPMVALRCE
jgi:predicted permease